MKIIGYSERGLINSLFYEIKFSHNNLQLLNSLLSLVDFPYRKVNFQISEAKIFIEQSFSDFGDADAVLLVNNQGNKQVIFVEAKVKTFQRYYKSVFDIDKEFEEFEDNIQKSEPINTFISNLFVQLYFKVRLIKVLQHKGIEQLKKGVEFPRCLMKKDRKTQERNIPRKIGNNDIVLNAVKQLEEYCKDALFVALLPDNALKLKNFYKKLEGYIPKGFHEYEWDIKDWGYLSWAQVKEFCEEHKLKETLENFEINRGQIY